MPDDCSNANKGIKPSPVTMNITSFNGLQPNWHLPEVMMAPSHPSAYLAEDGMANHGSPVEHKDQEDSLCPYNPGDCLK